MAKYSEAVLESIKARLPMSEVVSQYVRLNRKGDRWWGLCPFHHEKTPSFTVMDNGTDGFYKCFGCGKGGGIFNFIMEMEHVEFPEAVEMLARKAGIELKEESEQEKKEYSKQKTIADLYNRIIKTFHHVLLNNPGAEEARAYIAGRGITAETCEKFMLGYVPDSASWLYNFLRKNNYSDEILSESGLFSKDYGNSAFFRNRIMFPIRTWQGNCVAFSGRDLSGQSRAKYKNSPETVLYSKRSVLFGFYEGLKAIKEKKEIIICEGNFDVISLHQAGFENSCATCGTALTEEHLKLIKRYCDRIYLLFDSDSAGQNATSKALMLCQKADLANFVMRIDGAKDASELLEKDGPEAVQKCCVNSVPGFSYLVSSALKLYDIRQPKGKSSVFKEVKPYLDATSSQIERQGYIKYLSNVLRVSEEQIVSDYSNKARELPEQEQVTPVIKQRYNVLKTSTELTALLILLKNRDRFEQFRNEVKLGSLTDDGAKKLYTVLEDAIRQGIRTDDVILQMIDDEGLKDLAVSAFTSDMYRRMDVESTLENAVYQIKLRQLEEQRSCVLRMLNGSEMDMVNEDELADLLSRKVCLDKEIQELKDGMEGKD